MLWDDGEADGVQLFIAVGGRRRGDAGEFAIFIGEFGESAGRTVHGGRFHSKGDSFLVQVQTP